MRTHPFQRLIKRSIDILVSLSVLALSAPVLIVIGLVIRLKMGSPVLFRQQRPGINREAFTFYKLRTMSDELAPDGTLLPDGERLTGLGKFLRRWSLDELPQLWNVLIGDMSLVGPRPLRMDYLPYFTEKENIRHSVPPGITGLAQINGRNHASWDQRFANDVWYVEHWNLYLDLQILTKTLIQVILRKGVVVDPRSAMLNLNEERAYMNQKAH